MKKGELMILSTEQYSDFSFSGPYEAMKDFEFSDIVDAVEREYVPGGWREKAGPDVVLGLLDRIAELERDAARLDWIQRKFFEHKWNGGIDSGSQTNWGIWGGYRHITANMIGNTFGEAIDNAMKEQK